MERTNRRPEDLGVRFRVSSLGRGLYGVEVVADPQVSQNAKNASVEVRHHAESQPPLP